MILGTLHSMAFKVIKPIPVITGVYEDWFTAEWEAVGEFGYGPNPSAARDDLISSIRALYAVYETSLLGPALQEDWGIIRQHIVRVLP